MPFESKAFPAQDALVAALTAARDEAGSAIAEWLVDYGIPARRAERHLWVDEQVEGWTQDQATSGLVSRHETFMLTVYLYARQTAATALTLRDEIKAAADVVADAIGATPFLGGSVLYAQMSAGEYDSAFADAEGRSREAVLKLTVSCTAFVA